MERVIDLEHSVYELSKECPDLMNILLELGFHDIVKPGMLNTAGRFMTLPKGAAMQRIDLELIKKALVDKGYEIKE